MKIIKKAVALVFALVSMIETNAMNLDTLPTHQHLLSNECAAYSKLWDKAQSLAENKKNLVNSFFDNCIGNKFNVTEADMFHLSLWTKNPRGYLLATQQSEPSKYDAFRNVIEQIADTVEGCELLRVITTKYIVHSDYSKLSILEADKNKDLNYQAGRAASGLMVHSLQYADDKKSLLAYSKKGGGQFERKTIDADMRVSVYHELVHYLHSIETDGKLMLDTTDVFTERFKSILGSKAEKIKKYCKEKRLRGSDINWLPALQKLYKNDEDYRTLFGIFRDSADGSKFKYDPLNENAFRKSIHGNEFRCFHAILPDTEKSSLLDVLDDPKLAEFLSKKNFYRTFGNVVYNYQK